MEKVPSVIYLAPFCTLFDVIYPLSCQGPYRLVAEEGKSKCSWVSLDDTSNMLRGNFPTVLSLSSYTVVLPEMLISLCSYATPPL